MTNFYSHLHLQNLIYYVLPLYTTTTLHTNTTYYIWVPLL